VRPPALTEGSIAGGIIQAPDLYLLLPPPPQPANTKRQDPPGNDVADELLKHTSQMVASIFPLCPPGIHKAEPDVRQGHSQRVMPSPVAGVGGHLLPGSLPGGDCVLAAGLWGAGPGRGGNSVLTAGRADLILHEIIWFLLSGL